MRGDFSITHRETTLSVWQALNYHLIFLTLNVTILWRIDPRLINQPKFSEYLQRQMETFFFPFSQNQWYRRDLPMFIVRDPKSTSKGLYNFPFGAQKLVE